MQQPDDAMVLDAMADALTLLDETLDHGYPPESLVIDWDIHNDHADDYRDEGE